MQTALRLRIGVQTEQLLDSSVQIKKFTKLNSRRVGRFKRIFIFCYPRCWRCRWLTNSGLNPPSAKGG
ncbi:hypothetical protein R1flu_021179 [Riccia fluitans]|uniref:Uncharacterized protein n=1 Tax=Riccia fluitans TaxID=41844 RepID=A0ABD1ZQ89_9MARC